MGIKLLIVDDNPAVRRMIRRFVADLADEITEIDDGAGALAAYTSFLPDWVLMDIEMKQVSGIAAAAAITAAFPDANILMVTSYGDDILREKAAGAGARGYVLKENLFDLRGLLMPAA